MRSASVMMLACALLSADVLRRLPNGGRGLDVIECALLVVLSITIARQLVTCWGPQGGPVAVAAACAVVWIVHRVRSPRR